MVTNPFDLSGKVAVVTGGGIHLSEVDPKTMESRIVSGLYLCGEILDLDGPTGGYNLQAAFSTGYIAGQMASKGPGLSRTPRNPEPIRR